MRGTAIKTWATKFAKYLLWRPFIFAAMALLMVCGALFLAAHLLPLPERLDAGDSLVITYADDYPAHVLLAEDDRWRLPTGIDHVDPAYLDALVAFEDKRFYSHPGVDPIAVIRAAIDNLGARSVVSGASTITMQLVRILEPRPRTLRSKAIEAFRAFQLERHLTKEEILAAYLRFAPFGGNLEGVEAATLAYWQRTPAALSAAEIATLLAIPQNPNARRPHPENAAELRQARDHIARTLAAKNAIPLAARPQQLEDHLDNTAVPTNSTGLPRDIPHLVHWIRAHAPATATQNEAGRGDRAIRIKTTLERRIQHRLATIVADHRQHLQRSGAPHAAVVVMESNTSNLRGVIGNLSFDSAISGSHLQALTAPRATGSLLKPLAYGAALDQGLIAPSHQLMDVPMVRGDYRPQNFDRTYRGLIAAEEALALSLNLPFVRLLEDLGVSTFTKAAARLGLQKAVHRAGEGGLELVVGGLPASPLEVATLYAGIARGGQAIKPNIYADRRPDDQSEIPPAMTPAAAWLVQKALTRRPRPWSPIGSRRARDFGFVWKTGTSYAYHDAWTAGFGDQFTVAIWTGDLAYHRHPELIGSQVAAPLFFEIIESLDEPFDLRAARPDKDLAQIAICPRSGRRLGPHCPHQSTTLAPATTAAPARCNIHIGITVDADTGQRLPDGCRPDSVARIDHTVVERLPDPVARHARARGRRAGSMPPIHPDCQVEDRATLAISSPKPDTTVILEPTRSPDRQLVRLEAYSSAGSSLHWYLNGRHLTSSPSEEAVYWTPSPGTWTITAVDDRGERDSTDLVVQGLPTGDD